MARKPRHKARIYDYFGAIGDFKNGCHFHKTSYDLKGQGSFTRYVTPLQGGWYLDLLLYCSIHIEDYAM